MDNMSRQNPKGHPGSGSVKTSHMDRNLTKYRGNIWIEPKKSISTPTKQKVSYIVDLMALQLAFVYGI